MDVKQAIDRLAELHAKATPGRWYGDWFGNLTTHPPRRGLKALLPTTGIIAKVNKEQGNATAIAASHNALPALLEIARAVAREMIGSCGCEPADGHYCIKCLLDVDDALAALPRAVEEGTT